MGDLGKVGRIWLGSVLLASVTVNASHAMAQESAGEESMHPVDRWERRPLSAAVQVGLASPGGLIGLEVEYALQRWLVLGAGLGPTLNGWQAGAWLAPRWTLTSVAFGV